MAFLFGTLPTATIISLGRRILANRMPLQETTAGAQVQVQNLVLVDTFTAERLIDEGITSYAQLAYVDPVRLSIRSGLNFNVSVTLAGEALVALYASKPDQLDFYRKYGLLGSFEVANLWEDFNSDDLKAKQRATVIIDDLAEKLGIKSEVLQKNLAEIAFDPFTVFHRECWASNMPYR